VGLDDGKVVVIKTPAEQGFIRYEEIAEYKVHMARVMGIYYDNITGYV